MVMKTLPYILFPPVVNTELVDIGLCKELGHDVLAEL